MLRTTAPLRATLACALALFAGASLADDLPILHDMHQPDLSPDGSQVAFSYQGDLWLADLDDSYRGTARRLTVHEAYETRARFSPDGSRIAFVSDRYGNGDLFIMPIDGGPAQRVTYHSASDTLADWSPDGRKLLFYAGRREHDQTAPYEIDLESGSVRSILKGPFSLTAHSYSTDGRFISGSESGDSWTRKGYRGSNNGNAYLYDTVEGAYRLVTDFAGNDIWAQLSADAAEIYYVTEEFGRPNLAAKNLETGEIRQITRHHEDQVSFPSLSGDRKWLIYEWNFDLWVVDVRGGVPKKLEIRAPVDHRRNFEAEETRTNGIEEMEVNRDGSWVAVRLRDDIFLVKPAFKNGSVRVTDWPGMDGDYFWHPEGKRLYYISQQNRTADIWVYDTDTKEKKCLFEDDRYYEALMGFSPDAEKLLFRREAGGDGVWWADPETGDQKLLLEEPDIQSLSLSPDGKWIAACIDHRKSGQDVYVRPVDGGEWINVTKHPDGNADPQWSPDGKKLFFLSARSGSWQIYSIDLVRKPIEFGDYEEQFAKEADKAKPKTENGAPPASDAPAAPEAAQEGAEAPPAEEWPAWKPKPIDPMEIDFQRIEKRADRRTTSNVNEAFVGFTEDGKNLIFTRGGQIWTLNVEDGGQRQLVNGDYDLGAVRLTGDKKKLFFVGGGNLYSADPNRGGGATQVSFKAELDRDARVLQKWAFRQAWALLDERFYSHNLHGVDWDAVYDRYAEHCTGTLTNEDFQILVSKMIGELNASHLGCYGGPGAPGRGSASTASLGVTPDPAHAGPGIKVADVMPLGPTDQPDATVQAGEYILAINGEEIAGNTERASELLDGEAGERVKLLVNATPTTEGAREISVKPIANGAYWDLYYERWVERNREMAKRLSDGRAYYIHMNGMNSATLEQFRDELSGQAQLYDALIIDVRYNGGGYTHDSVMEMLLREVHAWQSARGTPLRPSPGAQFDGPMCVLTNRNSFSNAEIFPNAFRERGLGLLVGEQTAGGVIGTSDQPLVNGCTFRVPWVGWYRRDGASLENYGVPPDIAVGVSYEDFAKGRDRQIEAAVKHLMEQLEQGQAPAESPKVPGHRDEVLP